MAKKKQLMTKKGCFTDTMGDNVFVFQTDNEQTYVRKGQKRPKPFVKIYREVRNVSHRGRGLTGSPVRYI